MLRAMEREASLSRLRGTGRGPGRRSRLPFDKVVKTGLIKKAAFQ